METKLCTKCGEIKPVSDFYKSQKKGYQSYCKICANKHRTQWARENTHKTREYTLKYRYGLSPQEFNSMLEKQNGLCVLCGVGFGEDQYDICVDHDHSCCGGEKSCGQCIRGLLHRLCNNLVGKLETNDTLDKAIVYLRHASLV